MIVVDTTKKSLIVKNEEKKVLKGLLDDDEGSIEQA